MKKLLFLLLVLVLGVGCAFAEAPEGALLDMAEEAAESLAAMCGIEGYVGMYTSEGEIRDLVESWGGDWAGRGKFRRAAVAFLDRNALDEALPALLRALDMPEELLAYDDYVLRRVLSVPASLLNSREGVNWLAASSVANYSQTALMRDATPGAGYALLDYGEEHPLALATLFVTGDGIASVNVSLIRAGEVSETFFALANGELSLDKWSGEMNEALKGAGDGPEAEALKVLLRVLDEVRLRAY